MARRGWKRLTWLIVVTVVGIAGILGLIRFTGKERAALSFVERAFMDLLAPVQSGASSVVLRAANIWESVVSFNRVNEENQALKKEIGELRKENTQLKEYQLENIRLRDLLQYRQEKAANYDLVTAKVVGRSPSNWFRTLTIDRGSDDGIQKNMPVVTPEGLVGRILSVTSSNAQVMLITDREGAVPAMVQVNREAGIVEGSEDNSGLLQINHLRREAPVMENQIVITSGFGQIYPPGLRIGQVLRAETDPTGLSKRAYIRPFVDFNRLEEVQVIRFIRQPESLEGGTP